MIAFLYLASAIVGYVLGSIPSGVIISRRFTKTDIRQVGSGKTGMTNVLRTAGKKAAAISLVMDVVKGLLAGILAGWIFRHKPNAEVYVFTWMGTAKVTAAITAIIGHNWSMFLKFKGGRGVATFMGGLAGLYWPAAVLGGIGVLGLGFRTKYMSLGSIIGAVMAFIMLLAMYILRVNMLGLKYPPFEYVIYAMFGAVFIYVMHRDNIMRLYNGTERKVGEKAKTVSEPNTDKVN
jgi:acyl phosphate:glycerol-3-phosphate acyltransferase